MLKIIHVLTGKSDYLEGSLKASLTKAHPNETVRALIHNNWMIYYTGEGTDDEIIEAAEKIVEEDNKHDLNCQCPDCCTRIMDKFV